MPRTPLVGMQGSRWVRSLLLIAEQGPKLLRPMPSRDDRRRCYASNNAKHTSHFTVGSGRFAQTTLSSWEGTYDERPTCVG